MVNFATYFNKALKEQAEGKSLRDIQIETAMVWCGRACVAAAMDKHDDAVEYAHEAIEHAALSGQDGLLRAIRDQLRSYGVRL